ncbi:hypothetical protein [Enterobacter roggenkampii]|uniref:hypothetical protein n=1 Tax=Enterobacter roggenkampii TaxID=1812935 RepID=UPI002A840356|nr:hypothetical protein [Enterobacter roggenkampii]
MATFTSKWKAIPFDLMQPPYNFKPDVAMLYGFILDEFEHWSRNDKQGNGYTPAIAHLCNVFNQSESTIKRQLKQLKDHNLLTTKQRRDVSTPVLVPRTF